MSYPVISLADFGSKKRKRASSGTQQRKRARTATALGKALVARYPGVVRTGGAYGKYGINARNAGLQPELKFFDTNHSWSFDTTPEIQTPSSLNLIPQGTGEFQRDGRSCVIKSIQIVADLLMVPAAATTVSVGCFMALVLDTQANGAAPAFADVFDFNSAADCLPNLNNEGRFRVLKKWYWVFKPTAGVSAAYNHDRKHINFYKRCNIALEFSSSTGALTELRSNNIFLATASTGGDDLVSISGVSRLRFVG